MLIVWAVLLRKRSPQVTQCRAGLIELHSSSTSKLKYEFWTGFSFNQCRDILATINYSHIN